MLPNSSRAKRFSLFLTFVLVLSQAYAQSAGPEFPNPGSPGMSRDDQRQLGLQAAAQVYKQMPVLPDNSPQAQYIRQLGQKLAATIPSQSSWPFEFHVVAQKEINAFALPGGPMFINIGTITAASNEAELTGVMTHEMAHLYMQHSAKQAGKAEKTALLAGLASAILGATTGGLVAQLAQAGIQFGAQGLILRYSRDDESEADAVGAVILYKAGYNPQALADSFRTMESRGGAVPPQILSDHPNPGNRQAAIEKEIRNWPPKNYPTNSAAFRKVHQQSANVRAYSAQEISQGAKSGQWVALNQKNGAVFRPNGASAANTSTPTPAGSSPSASAVSLQNILPGQRLVTADLGRLKISRPESWQVMMPKRQGESLMIAPQAGVTGNAVGYGVVINAVAPPNGSQMSIDQTTAHLVQDMQDSGGVQAIGKPQSITVNGVQGRSVAIQSPSPFRAANGQQQIERDWMVTLPQRDGSVIFMVFVAPQSEFSRFQPTYEAMLKSVQF